MKTAQKPKILLISTELDFGGVETAVHDRALALREVGYTVDIACLNKLGRIGKKLQEYGFKVQNLDLPPRVPNFRIILKLIKLLREVKPDIIHTSSIEANFHGLLASRISGVGKVIVEEVGILTDGYGKQLRSWKARKVGYLIWNNADSILVISQAIKQSIIECEGAPESRVTVIPYYIDLDRYKFAANAGHLAPKNEFIIGYVARLSFEKGQRVLLPALKLALQKNENIKLWLIGDGPDKENLKNMVVELGIGEKVKFWGMREDIPELLAQMDLFVLSSYNEGLGTVILEAMASGIPVIASKVGGVLEIIEHRENGVMFPVGDIEVLAEEIARMINLDEAERSKIIRKARENIETHYSKASVIKQLSDLYFSTWKNINIKNDAVSP